MNNQKAIFIDKDGTLIPDIPYNVNPGIITITDDVIKSLKKLQQSGFIFLIITNQSGVAKGYFKESDLTQVKTRIEEILGAYNISIAGFYYCPHHPDGIIEHLAITCNCRKPGAGMILSAAKDHGIDLQSSWMIGDILHDVEAGNSAGCKTVLLNNGNETEWIMNTRRKPDYIAAIFSEAADIISQHSFTKRNETE